MKIQLVPLVEALLTRVAVILELNTAGISVLIAVVIHRSARFFVVHDLNRRETLLGLLTMHSDHVTLQIEKTGELFATHATLVHHLTSHLWLPARCINRSASLYLAAQSRALDHMRLPMLYVVTQILELHEAMLALKFEAYLVECVEVAYVVEFAGEFSATIRALVGAIVPFLLVRH